MPNDEQKTVALVAKLTRMTKEGQLKWFKESPPSSLTRTTNEEVAAFYSATYNDRHLGLYDVRYRYWNEDGEIVGWGQRYELAIFDDEGEVLWAFPSVPGIRELFSSVQYQSADVNKLFDDLLGHDEGNATENGS
jgi:hypothetical protein